MSSVAIITARGGSKRIPKKNIRDFCGKPIISYSISAALESRLFDEVMVSTDSEEIAEIALRYGAKVPFMRSEEMSNDYASTSEVILEVLEEYRAFGKSFDIFACIYPTAVFLTAPKLRRAAKILTFFNADSVVPVVKYSYPPQRAFVLYDGFVRYQHPEFINSRSQDLEPLYHDCGQFYFCRTDAFLKKKSVVTDKSMAYILREEEVQDIDMVSDWNVAEAKYLALQKEQY